MIAGSCTTGSTRRLHPLLWDAGLCCNAICPIVDACLRTYFATIKCEDWSDRLAAVAKHQPCIVQSSHLMPLFREVGIPRFPVGGLSDLGSRIFGRQTHARGPPK